MSLPIILVAAFLTPSAYAKDVLTLHTFVEHARSASQSLRARAQAEVVARAGESVAQTGYYPTIEGDAIYTTGFPGSTSALGVGGIMGSPYRQGYAMGFTAKQTLFDFGLTHRELQLGHARTLNRQAETQVEDWSVTQNSIALYYACARLQTSVDVWSEISEASRDVQVEVERLVRTGQRTTVDGMLAKAQEDDARRQRDMFAQQSRIMHQRLEVLTGLAAAQIDCPSFKDEAQSSTTPNAQAKGSSAILHHAESERRLAEAEVSRARAGYLPKLTLVGSVGDLTQVRLVEKKDYSVGVGLIVPIFDGLRTSREVDQALALREQKELEVRAAQQYVDDFNLKLEQAISSDFVAMDRLRSEVENSRRALNLARKRYLAFAGHLVDVRESIRNYTRFRLEMANVQTEWLEASALKAAFNGENL